jgi:uncharacterized protein YgiM (DUF1202 family)
MKNILPPVAALGLMTALSLVGSLSALAQQARMGVAAHKGTFNYLRTGPNTHTKILEKMPQGTQMEIVGQSGDYYAVVLADGTHGWTYITNIRFV